MKQYKEETSVHEDRRNSYKIQTCSTCDWNWDFNLGGRVMQCGGCGAWNKESSDKKNKLIRVG